LQHIKKKKNSKTPPCIAVGNGLSTKSFPEEVVMDAFKVFSELSKTQQGLFVGLKDILIKGRMTNYRNKRKVDNPTLVTLERSKSNSAHQDVKDKMSQNRNRKTLEINGILKQIKPGQYMLNPYILFLTKTLMMLQGFGKSYHPNHNPST
jgi:hypothetical protein